MNPTNEYTEKREKQKDKNVISWIITLEIAGFILVLIVIWLDELADLPHLMFGEPMTPARIGEALLESVSVLLVCASVIISTILLFRRIRKLESYIVMCAWCRKVKLESQWITVEEYLNGKEGVVTSHGLCESCAEKRVVEIKTRSLR